MFMPRGGWETPRAGAHRRPEGGRSLEGKTPSEGCGRPIQEHRARPLVRHAVSVRRGSTCVRSRRRFVSPHPVPLAWRSHAPQSAARGAVRKLCIEVAWLSLGPCSCGARVPCLALMGCRSGAVRGSNSASRPMSGPERYDKCSRRCRTTLGQCAGGRLRGLRSRLLGQYRSQETEYRPNLRVQRPSSYDCPATDDPQGRHPLDTSPLTHLSGDRYRSPLAGLASGARSPSPLAEPTSGAH